MKPDSLPAVSNSQLVLPSANDLAMLAAALQDNPVGGLLLVMLFGLAVAAIWGIRGRAQDQQQPARGARPPRRRKKP